MSGIPGWIGDKAKVIRLVDQLADALMATRED